MDTRTGRIVIADDQEIKRLNERAVNDFVQIVYQDMTPKQKREMQVSLDDHRSVLGKHLSRLRNQPCACGSKMKTKKCCGKVNVGYVDLNE